MTKREEYNAINNKIAECEKELLYTVKAELNSIDALDDLTSAYRHMKEFKQRIIENFLTAEKHEQESILKNIINVNSRNIQFFL